MKPMDYRFIPACAGNSQSRPPSCRSPTVHPRVCGEQERVIDIVERDHGSSPRVRGTGCRTTRRRSFCRFIPACAGNRDRSGSRSRTGPVHPRVCGEQHPDLTGFDGRVGSSPRVRGTGCALLRPLAKRRFIPACAGNRGVCKRTWYIQPVHPRVCGEQIFYEIDGDYFPGSSPRVRGTVPVWTP